MLTEQQSKVHGHRLEGITYTLLVADGFGGQKKNMMIDGMACMWLRKYAQRSIISVTLLCTVVGHFLILRDRVFGKIEKDIKAKLEIVNTTEYEEIILKNI